MVRERSRIERTTPSRILKQGSETLSAKAVCRHMEIMKAYDWDSLPWEEVRPGVRRKGFRSKNTLMVLNELQPGMETHPHSHPFEQLAYVVQGRVRFTIGDEVHEMGPGGLCVIPPDITHFADILGDEPAVNIDIFSPVREDYLHLTETQTEY